MKKIIFENGSIFMLPEDRAEELGFKVVSCQIGKLRDLVFFKSETNRMEWLWREEGYYYLVNFTLDNIITQFKENLRLGEETYDNN